MDKRVEWGTYFEFLSFEKVVVGTTCLLTRTRPVTTDGGGDGVCVSPKLSKESLFVSSDIRGAGGIDDPSPLVEPDPAAVASISLLSVIFVPD